jgi:hypothetical protein
MVKKTINALACAVRAFGVCANEHEDHRANDSYSTNNMTSSQHVYGNSTCAKIVAASI